MSIERTGDHTSFAFLGGPLPAPALRGDLAAAERQDVLQFYANALNDLARADGVAYGSVRMPFTGMLQCANAAVNPWLRFGFIDLPHATQVVDLRQPEESLWADVRKGHRSDIKRAAQQAKVHFWDAASVTTEKCHQYQALHAKDAGRVTRSQATFDMMEQWVRRGHAVLAETEVEGKPAAFAVVMQYKGAAYYGSGCRDPDVAHVPVSHLLQWDVIRWLKQQGCQLYDIGMQFFGPQWFHLPSAKDMSIAAFKRGFGGRTVPLVTAERFYSPAALERTFASRVQAYIAATSGAPVAD